VSHAGREELKDVGLVAVTPTIPIQQELVDFVKQDDHVLLLLEHLEDALGARLDLSRAASEKVADRDRQH
jgi:hypothetical protein